MESPDISKTIDAVWKIESPRLIAALARMTRDVGLAEDLAQDALVAALEQWPSEGVPRNPGAWLMAIAKRRGIDHFRRNTLVDHKHAQLGYEMEARQQDAAPDFDAALDDDVGDDLLRLIFTACHPVLSTDARVTLTLKLLAGLTTEEIARAFLATETTIQQRIVRAKRTLADKKVAYEVPGGPELSVRLASVLEVIYLIFNEGYSATAGDDWMRPALCAERLRSARGPYTLQAAIAACHARARQANRTDWNRIASLYDELATTMPSPIVELNRAVAHGMAFGPDSGLAIVEPLVGEPALHGYPYLPGVRADLLFKLKRFDEARTEFERAAALTKNASQKALLLAKARDCQSA